MNGSPGISELAVFEAVWRLRSVSRAAEEAGLTQPAASNAIRRLREHFGDPLFVRTQTGMQATPLAEEIGPDLAEALAKIRSSLTRRSGFDPENARRGFTIAMTDIGEFVFLPPLLRYLSASAPGISLHTIQLSDEAATKALESGKADLAVGYRPEMKTGVFQQSFFTTSYVCIVASGHHFIDDPSREAFLQGLHAVADNTGSQDFVEQLLARFGPRRIGLRAINHLCLPSIVACTNMIATVSEPFAAASLATADIKLLPHPMPLPQIEIKQFWHERFHEDPANRWLRQICAKLFQRQAPPLELHAQRI